MGQLYQRKGFHQMLKISADQQAKAGFVAYCAIEFYLSRYSNGNHIWDTPIAKEILWLKVQIQTSTPPIDVNMEKYTNITTIFYAPLIFITKLSILLQYISIFVPTHRSHLFYWIYALIWINFLFYLADTLVEIFQCVPRDKIWDPTLPGRCVNVDIAFTTTAVVNVISDFSILLLPLGRVWQLQMSTRRKLIVSAVFATGLL